MRALPMASRTSCRFPSTACRAAASGAKCCDSASALTLAAARLGCPQRNAIEAYYGESHHYQSETGVQRRHRFLLRDTKEFAHHDRQAGEEEIRPGRQEARRVPRIQDQVTRGRRPQKRAPQTGALGISLSQTVNKSRFAHLK